MAEFQTYLEKGIHTGLLPPLSQVETRDPIKMILLIGKLSVDLNKLASKGPEIAVGELSSIRAQLKTIDGSLDYSQVDSIEDARQIIHQLALKSRLRYEAWIKHTQRGNAPKPRRAFYYHNTELKERILSLYRKFEDQTLSLLQNCLRNAFDEL